MAERRLLHVLGGGPWQMPTVRRARELGYRVLVTDIHPERPAYDCCDLHEVADITDPEATLDVARRHTVDGVICDSTDIGVYTAAYVAEQLGLPGIGTEVALNFTRKDRLRQCLARAELPSPAYGIARSEVEARQQASTIGYPVVVKPVDSQSSRGVGVVHQPAALGPACAEALAFSRAGSVIVEGHVTGTEVIVDGFVLDGVVQVLGVASKIPCVDAPTVATRISYPAQLEPGALLRLDDVHRRTIAALGLHNGVYHAEYIVAVTSVVPIDVAARGGGVNIYTHVTRAVSGVDPIGAMVRLAMGELAELTPAASRRAANIEFLFAEPGEVERVDGLTEALARPGILAIHLNASAGRRFGQLSHKDERAGHIVAEGATLEEAIMRCQQARDCIHIVMRREAAK